MGLYNFILGRIITPNANLAQAKTLDPLPAFSVFEGWRVRSPIRAWSAAPPFLATQAWRDAGVGGLVQGGITFQSLTRNPNPNQ